MASHDTPKNEREAILILPGFGSKVHGTKDIAETFFKGNKDVFIPDYISRKSIHQCALNLHAFYKKEKLNEYKKIHVFSYIVGSWTLNDWITFNPNHNIASIVYDRSPLQERAPYALVEDMPFLIRIISGPIMKEFANTPYAPMKDSSINVGILIENKATKLIHKHKKSAMKKGPVQWEVDSLYQTYTDFTYIYMNHDELYTEIEKTVTEILAFIENGKFSANARREKHIEDPFKSFLK